jgi:anthranilate phosphoribosyltransferase
VKELIRKLGEGEHLTRQEAAQGMRTIMEGKATDAQIGGLLIGLKLNGEQTEELLGLVDAMREKGVRITIDDADAVDLCGTGGDRLGTFNISTAASFVVAGAGVTVAKHGNRSVSSACGSADVLEALGVNLTADPEAVAECINSVGLGFLFAPMFHPAMKSASRPRSELGLATCFNLLGPMTNPAGVRRQVVGAHGAEAARSIAGVFRQLRPERVFVVASLDGLDEVSLSSPTAVWEVEATGGLREYEVTHRDLGLPPAGRESIRGGTDRKSVV